MSAEDMPRRHGDSGVATPVVAPEQGIDHTDTDLWLGLSMDMNLYLELERRAEGDDEE